MSGEEFLKVPTDILDNLPTVYIVEKQKKKEKGEKKEKDLPNRQLANFSWKCQPNYFCDREDAPSPHPLTITCICITSSPSMVNILRYHFDKTRWNLCCIPCLWGMPTYSVFLHRPLDSKYIFPSVRKFKVIRLF